MGLEFIHNNAILHRDLRPSNIFFDEKGYAKIGDFGMSRIWRKMNSSDTSGTPGYMAPEVLLHEPQGTGVDYFALGVITHELMMGKRPWAGDDRETYKENLLNTQVILKKNDTKENW